MDATFTVASGKNSGIERVVCSIFRESTALATAENGSTAASPAPTMVITHAGRFYEVDAQYVADCRRLGTMHSNVLASTSQRYQRLAKRICQWAGSSLLRRWLLPTSGHLGIFKLSHTWQSKRASHALARRQRPIEFQPDDLVLLPDAYWINRLRHSVWPAAALARRQGAFVVTLLYDLIPLTHPEFVGERRRIGFLDYLHKSATNSDMLLTISKTVREQVVAFLASSEPPAEAQGAYCKDIRPFTLGAELSVSTGEVRSHVLPPFEGTPPPYLMVATFDPRKNHHYLLDVFDRLWSEQRDVRLSLVGRIGARCDDVVTRVCNHPQLGQRLFLFDDLSDAELQHCYRNARAVVFPSIVEGFGLPIVESLWFGKKTFASDTPIHREVGGADCEYFTLDDPQSLADKIVAWEGMLSRRVEGGPPLPPQVARTPVNWRGSAQELLAHCMDAYRLRSTAEQRSTDEQRSTAEQQAATSSSTRARAA
jgi:glycosyltransferase involved in cell wall biosynthesis